MLKSILIIEDDDFLRTLMTNRLEDFGYRVSGAPDGEIGLEKLDKNPVDLLVLDLVLPGKTGFEVLKALREGSKTKDQKVIIFSNHGDEEDISRAKVLGAKEYLVKSNFTLNEFVKKVETVLEG